MPKIYTKTGDTGVSSFWDGTRAPKSDIVFDTVGNLDYLTVKIGSLHVLIGDDDNFLRRIQLQIQVIASHVATPDPTKRQSLYQLKQADIDKLETSIDDMEKELPKLTQFILPCTNNIDSVVHECRVLARQAERRLVELVHWDTLQPEIKKYINRLSDYFFVLARFHSSEDVVGVDLF
jgi:cob(I)alamin adenosyltransferase